MKNETQTQETLAWADLIAKYNKNAAIAAAKGLTWNVSPSAIRTLILEQAPQLTVSEISMVAPLFADAITANPTAYTAIRVAGTLELM